MILNVSILVLLDFVLKEIYQSLCKTLDIVSILVLLDFVLKGLTMCYGYVLAACFNPCFIGFCS